MRVIGVDLGGTNILVRLVDTETGRSRGRVKATTPGTGPTAVLGTVIDSIRKLDQWETADAIGIGLPGLVAGGGVVQRCPNIHGWDSPVAVVDIVSGELGKPVAVANDVDCGALAEHRVGAGQGVSELLAVFVGTGVGGGLVLDNRVVAGARGMVGEIGHVTVVPGGRLCGCGGLGHLEAYAGRAGIEAELLRQATAGVDSMLVEQATRGPIRSRHLAAAVEAGDPVALAILAEATDVLAMVIGNIATILDLPRVVLGGGVVDKFGTQFLDAVRDSEHFGGFGSSVCELRLATRLDDAGVVGAAMLAGDRFG